MKTLRIAVDGYASTGKSTLAKRLASRRGAVLGVFPVTTNAFDPVAVDTAFSETQPAAPSGRRRVGFMPQMLIRQALGWVLSPLLSPLGLPLLPTPWPPLCFQSRIHLKSLD
jgi:hypothetical protein